MDYNIHQKIRCSAIKYVCPIIKYFKLLSADLRQGVHEKRQHKGSRDKACIKRDDIEGEEAKKPLRVTEGEDDGTK